MRCLLVLSALVFCSTAIYPNIHFHDSGELATASVFLGIGHSPGQPLYHLLSHLFLYIPFGSLGFRLCLFSLVCTIASLLLLQEIFFKFFATSRRERILVTLLLATFPLHLFVHSQAGRIELYSLQMLLCCAALYGYFRSKTTPLEGFLTSLGAIALSALNHPLLGVMLIPVLLPSFVRCIKEWGRGRLLPAGLAVTLPPLSLLLYCVIRSSGATGAWLTIDSADLWWRYITGFMYAGNFSPGQPFFFDHFLVILKASLPSFLIFLAAAWIRPQLLKELWMPALLFFTGLLPSTLQSRFFPDNPDYYGYLLLSLVAALVMGGAALLVLLRRLEKRSWSTYAFFAIALLLSWMGRPSGIHSHIFDQRAVDLSYRIADALPVGPVIVDLASDSTLFPVAYLRDVAGIRPDVLIAHPTRFGNKKMLEGVRQAGYATSGWPSAYDETFKKKLKDLNPQARLLLVSPVLAQSDYGLPSPVFKMHDFLYEVSGERVDSCHELLTWLRQDVYHPLPLEDIEEIAVTGLAFRQFSYDLRLGRFECAGKVGGLIGREIGVDLGQLGGLENRTEKPDLFFPVLERHKAFFQYDRAEFLIRAADMAFSARFTRLGSDLCLEAYALGRPEAAQLALLWSERLGLGQVKKIFLPLCGDRQVEN